MTPPPLSLYLFGPFRALVHGEPLPRLRTRSVEWLLALLTLRHGRAVERSWLAGTLWPESEESQALENLRHDLVCLRKALGPESGRVQSPTRATLTLDLQGAEVDLIRFDAAVRAGDEASLRQAVEAYTGPLLEGCLQEWAVAERELRETACLGALEALADASMARADFAQALVFLRRAEALDPLRDSTARRLMQALAAQGDVPAALRAYREHRLKLRRELSVEPDEATTRLYRDLHASAREAAPRSAAEQRPGPGAAPSAVPLAAAPSAVPHSLTRLLGREQEVWEVREWLGAQRLVTLVGAGGVGKTRLALQVAQEVSEGYADGAAFAALASLADPALLTSFVATALGLREEESAEPGSLLQRLVGWLAARDLLLVLDNCEHLVAEVAALVQSLLERCPRLRVLATSRQRLGLTGEVVWRVPSLPSPCPDDLPPEGPEAFVVALRYPAVQLFVERAGLVRPGLQLREPREARAVALICRRLDGIPLAIELAAARTSLLTVEQIAERLDDRFRLLTGGSRGDLTRHQTLRALIDWSHDLLSEEERRLLRRLSVFVGGWTLEATEAVSESAEPSTPAAPSHVLDVLSSLVDKSLVLAEEGEGGLRYRMLETVREYALERLRESGEEAALRDRHLAYYLRVAEEAEPELSSPSPQVEVALLELETGNFRAALGWAEADRSRAEAALRLAAALWRFWEISGYHTEGQERLRAALAQPGLPDSPAKAKALLGAGALAQLHVDHERAHALLRESQECSRRLGDARGEAAALLLLGHLALERNDVAGGQVQLNEALELCRRTGWEQGSALARVHLGQAAVRQGDGEAARSLLEQGLAQAEALGDLRAMALALLALGSLFLDSGVYDRAARLLGRSLAIWRRLGHRHSASLALRHLGVLARRRGDIQQAIAYLEETAATFREMGNSTHLAIVLLEVGNVHYEQGAYHLARPTYVESLDLFRKAGYVWGITGALNTLGSTLLHLGDPRQAEACHREALGLYLQAWPGVEGRTADRQSRWSFEGATWTLERLAVVEGLYGEPPRAVRLLGVADALRGSLGARRDPWDQRDWDQASAAVCRSLGVETLDILMAPITDLDAAVLEVVDDLGLPVPPRPAEPTDP